jgi:hypothetical protein
LRSISKEWKRKRKKKIEEKKKTNLSLRWDGGASVTRWGGSLVVRCCIEVSVKHRSRSSWWHEALYRGGDEASVKAVEVRRCTKMAMRRWSKSSRWGAEQRRRWDGEVSDVACKREDRGEGEEKREEEGGGATVLLT